MKTHRLRSPFWPWRLSLWLRVALGGSNPAAGVFGHSLAIGQTIPFFLLANPTSLREIHSDAEFNKRHKEKERYGNLVQAFYQSGLSAFL
jgi:hypothetical protein